MDIEAPNRWNHLKAILEQESPMEKGFEPSSEVIYFVQKPFHSIDLINYFLTVATFKRFLLK